MQVNAHVAALGPKTFPDERRRTSYAISGVKHFTFLMLLDLLAALDEVHGLQTCLTHPVPFGTINN